MNTFHELFTFLQIQTVGDAQRNKIEVHLFQQLCVKYSELNITAMNAEVHCLRYHMVLFKVQR